MAGVTQLGRTDRAAVGKDQPTRKREFGAALKAALARVDVTQTALGQDLGVAHSTVSDWVTGTNEPSAVTVFRIEAILGLEPGELSTKLGYVPVEAIGTVEAAILADQTLDERWRETLLALVRNIGREAGAGSG